MADTALEKPKHRNQHPPSITKAKQRDFLTVLVHERGNIRRACLRLGIGETMPHEWASKSAEFAKRLEEAKALGEKALLDWYENKVDERADAGKEDPQSAVLTMFRMKKLDPRYRDNAQVNVIATGPLNITSSLADGRPKLPER